jgi:hypothetical protein
MQPVCHIVVQRCMHPVPARDRYLAAAVHVGSIFAPIWVPAIAWVIFRKSVYVASHARKAIFGFLALKVGLLIVGTASLIYTLSRLWTLYQNDWQGFSLLEFGGRFLVGWILLSLVGVVTTVISIAEAHGALKGRWPRSHRPASANPAL